MIRILGFKRVLTLAILLAANVILGILVYYVLTPQKTKAEQELRATRAAVETRRTEVATLKTEFEQIQEQKSLFGNLQKSGFFGTQDRVEARRMIEQIQASSDVLSARYDIKPVEVRENPTAALADHVVLYSPMSVSLDALDDVDVYSFMYWMENSFPGHAGITGLTIERKLDVDEVTLKQIGNGVPVVLVSAQVDFDWNTMVPRAQAPLQAGQPALPQ